MAMFRRKTDQVYATLQQVQRRISQQTQGAADNLEREVSFAPGGSGPVPSPAPASVAPSVPAAPAPPPASMPAIVDTSLPIDAPMPSTQAQPLTWPTAPSRPALTLPWEVATIIFLFWVASIVGVFFIGHQFGKRAHEITQGPASAGTQVATDASAAPVRRGLLVLSSVAKPTSEAEKQFRANADMLNAHARSQAQHGYKPWFGVRKPTNGGLQLVFGVVDGEFGVDRDAYASLAEALIRAGYKDARWIPLE